MRLLLAEDERDLNRIISRRLIKEGYSVDAFYNGEDALYAILTAEYDAAILDIAMPKLDGLELLKGIRQKRIDIPVLMLTARDSVRDRVKGLDEGADDYLVKPFDFDELLARLRVLLRRKSNNATNIFTALDLTVDSERFRVTRSGKEIELSSKEFAILEYMIMNKNIVLTREKIENHIWNFDYEGGSNLVDVYIRYLRKKIDDDYETKLIRTVRGRGYVLRDADSE